MNRFNEGQKHPLLGSTSQIGSQPAILPRKKNMRPLEPARAIAHPVNWTTEEMTTNALSLYTTTPGC